MKKGRIIGGGFGALLALATAVFFIGPPEPPKASAQVNSQCLNNSPGFTAGGNVFQRSAAQWNQYFASKVDAVNGVLCNPTIIGTPPFPSMPPHTVAANPTNGVAPAISTPSNTGTISIDNGSIDLPPTGLTAGTYTKTTFDIYGRATAATQSLCSDIPDAGTACLANTGTSLHTLGFLDGNKTDSGNNTYSGTNAHNGSETFNGTTDVVGTALFATVNGTKRTVTGTSDTLSISDCGKSVVYTNGATVTVTNFSATGLAANRACAIAVIQKGAGNVVFAAAGGTSYNNPIACTRAFGQGAIASLYVEADDPNYWFLGGSCLP